MIEGVLLMNNRILEIINDILEIKDEKTLQYLDSRLSLREDLDFDSFDLALLTAKIEDEFDIDIFEDGVITTIDEILKKLPK